MKKLCLLSGMMILGANTLNSMQPLPKELQQEVFNTALAASKNLKESINVIKNTSALKGIRYDNLKDFTRLAHMLADKFNVSTEEVAQQFGTSVSKKYIELGRALLNAAYWPSWTIDVMVDWIKEGADVEFTSNILGGDQIMFPVSPLKAAIMQRKEIHKIYKLLEYKADPAFNGDLRGIRLDGGSAFDVFVKSALEEAKKK